MPHLQLASILKQCEGKNHSNNLQSPGIQFNWVRQTSGKKILLVYVFSIVWILTMRWYIGKKNIKLDIILNGEFENFGFQSK